MTPWPARGADQPDDEEADEPEHRAEPDHAVADERRQVLVVEDDRIGRRGVAGRRGLHDEVGRRRQRIAGAEEGVGLDELEGRVEVGEAAGADAARAHRTARAVMPPLGKNEW